MVAAGVVVANPILAPSADVRIPAVSLSAGTADSMLDKSFLDAIAPAPSESSGPFSVLKQLVNALAADVTYLGKNAIVDAFVAGVGAVSGPGLGTAPSTTTVVLPSPVPAPPITAPPTVSNIVQMPHVDASVLSSAISTVPADIASVTTSFVNGSVAQVEDVVSAIAYDATYVGKNVLTAAFAVGAAVAAEPALIGETLKALINGDINGALQNAVKAVVKVVETPISSTLLIINAFKDVIQNRLQELAAIFLPAAQPATGPAPSVDVAPPSATGGTDSPSVPAPTGRRPRSGDPVLLSGSRTRATAPAAAVPGARAAAGAVRDAVRGVAEQVGAQVDAAVQKPVGKVARARAAAAAR